MATSIQQVGVSVALNLTEVSQHLTQQFNQTLNQVTNNLTQNTFVQALEKVEDSAFQVQDALGGVAQKLGDFIGSALKSLEKIKPGPDALGVVTAGQVRTAKAYQQSMKSLNEVLQAVQIRVALGVAPKLTELATRFLDFLKVNKVLIGEGLGRVVTVLGEALDALDNVAQAVDAVIRATVGWKAALLLLGAALVWIKRASLAAFAVNPVAWLVAAIAALILLVDDFMTYLEGGESALGDFWAPFKDGLLVASAALAEFKALFASFWEENGESVQAFADGLLVVIGAGISNLINLFKGLFALLNGDFDALRAAFDGWFEGLKAQFDMLGMAFGKVAGWLGFGEEAEEGGEVPGGTPAPEPPLLGTQAAKLVQGADLLRVGVQGAQASASGARLLAPGPVSQRQTHNYQQQVQVHVSGNEPVQTARQVVEQITRHQQRLAMRNNSSPIRQ